MLLIVLIAPQRYSVYTFQMNLTALCILIWDKRKYFNPKRPIVYLIDTLLRPLNYQQLIFFFSKALIFFLQLFMSGFTVLTLKKLHASAQQTFYHQYAVFYSIVV